MRRSCPTPGSSDAEVTDFLSFMLPVAAEPAAAGRDAVRALPDQRHATRATDPASEFTLDIRQVRNSFSQAAATYDQAAVLQRQVRDELLGRLDVLRMQPAAVLDLGAGTGQGTIALKRRYPGSRVVAMDLAPGMLQQARKRQTLLRRFDRVVADAAALPVGDATFDMIFSSLMLQWCNDPDRVLRECRRALRPGGVLHFTTLGPDTLVELRRSWQAADPGHAHVNRFIDMHDLGDALTAPGSPSRCSTSSGTR